jgi:triosephosphate isomerase (TIM)
MSNKIIIANFKMNLTSKEEAIDLCQYYQQKDKELPNVDFIAAPDFLWLEDVVKLGVATSSQDCFFEDSGAFTGEISPMILKSLGVQYCIIGHSERRKLGDTDEIINKKVKAVLKNGLIPILCVGETLEQKQSGQKEEVLKNQTIKALDSIPPSTLHSLIVAYEPVWAIGTGLAEDPDEAEKTMEFILNLTKQIITEAEIKIIYGGSVDAVNIGNFVSKKIIQGALVGGSSLKKEEFAKILEIANSSNNPS